MGLITGSVKKYNDVRTQNTVLFTISRTSSVSKGVVYYKLSDNTTTYGKDYGPITPAFPGGDERVGSVTFEEGQTEETISIPIIDDSEMEPDETFTVELIIPEQLQGTDVGYVIGESSKCEVTILSDSNDEKKLYAVANLPGMTGAYASWGDVDNDGDMDMLLLAKEGNSFKVYTYAASGNTTTLSMTPIGSLTVPATSASADFCDMDFDNDGDIVLVSEQETNVYLWNGSTYVPTESPMPGYYQSKNTVLDINNDSKPDFIVSGVRNNAWTIDFMYSHLMTF